MKQSRLKPASAQDRKDVNVLRICRPNCMNNIDGFPFFVEHFVLVGLVVFFLHSFLTFISFPCWQIYITDPATKQLLKEQVIFSLCALLAIPVWLCCLWLPLWWSNFVAILLQISMWLLGLSAMVYSDFVARTRGDLGVVGWTRKPLNSLALMPLSLLVLSTVMRIVLSKSQSESWELPQLLQPLQALQASANDFHHLPANMSNTTRPDECEQIYVDDAVMNASEAEACVKWCRGVDLFLPSLVPTDSDNSCFKAEAAWAFPKSVTAKSVTLPGFPVSLPLHWVLALMYCLPALRVTWVSMRGSTRDGDHDVSSSDECSLCSATPKDLHHVLPSTEGFDRRGPFESPGSLDLIEQMCKLTTANDFEAARALAKVNVALNFLEIASDVTSTLILFSLGQPFYGGVILTFILLPNISDPFQTLFAKALAKATQQGMQSADMWHHQQREGLEGSMSCIIALCALMRTPHMSWDSTALLCLTVCTSLLGRIPNGNKARMLLQAGVNSNDYYEAFQAKKRMEPAQKHLFSAQVMHVGCLAGTTALHHFNEESNSNTFEFSSQSMIYFVGLWACGVFLVGLLDSEVAVLLPRVRWISGAFFWSLHWMDVFYSRKLHLSEWCIRQLAVSILGTFAFVVLVFLHRSRVSECQLRGLIGLRPPEPQHVDQWILSGCPEQAKNSGKFYFEIQFVGDANVACPAKVGWLSIEFDDGEKSGFCSYSRVLTSFDSRLQHFFCGHDGRKWNGGDVVGFAIDLDTGAFSCFSPRGNSSGTISRPGPALYPAIRTFGCFFRLHLAESEWQLQPPEGYQEWARGEHALVSNLMILEEQIETTDISDISDASSGSGLCDELL